MRQTELKLSEEDRLVIEGIRSKGLHQAREVTGRSNKMTPGKPVGTCNPQLQKENPC